MLIYGKVGRGMSTPKAQIRDPSSKEPFLTCSLHAHTCLAIFPAHKHSQCTTPKYHQVRTILCPTVLTTTQHLT